MNKITLGIAILLLGACAHHNDVRPSEDGIHRVSVSADTKEAAASDALGQAKHFCKDTYKKIAAIQTEDAKYTGDMNETHYKIGKKVGDILSKTGSVLTGSKVNDAMGKAYTANMTFKCI